MKKYTLILFVVLVILVATTVIPAIYTTYKKHETPINQTIGDIQKLREDSSTQILVKKKRLLKKFAKELLNDSSETASKPK